MLLNYTIYCYPGLILISLLCWGCAGYAYRVNARRAEDDPDKKDFHPLAVQLAPFTWPVLLLLLILSFVVRALLYGIFLILFTLALIVVRKPFLLIWIERTARKIGDKLNEANTFLIWFFFGRRRANPQPL